MPDNDIESVDNWSFPDVHHDSEAQESDPQFLDEFSSEEGIRVPTVQDLAVEAAQQKVDDKAQAANEINALKQAYHDKLQVVNTLIERLQTATAMIDNDVVSLIQEIIQKMAKKILHREIATSPDVIANMVAELKAIVPAGTPMVNVLLSPHDYQQLCNENGEPQIEATALDSLSIGDIVIRSNITEIRAILDDRIEKLLEAQNE